MALSRSPLPIEVFQAVATSTEEAEALAYKASKEKKKSMARSLVRW